MGNVDIILTIKEYRERIFACTKLGHGEDSCSLELQQASNWLQSFVLFISREEKGERWIASFICFAQNMVSFWQPPPLQPQGYKKPFLSSQSIENAQGYTKYKFNSSMLNCTARASFGNIQFSDHVGANSGKKTYYM